MACVSPNKWQRAALAFLEDPREDARLLAIASPHEEAGLKTLAALLLYRFLTRERHSVDSMEHAVFHPVGDDPTRFLMNSKIRELLRSWFRHQYGERSRSLWPRVTGEFVCMRDAEVLLLYEGEVQKFSSRHFDLSILLVLTAQAFFGEELQRELLAPWLAGRSDRVIVLLGCFADPADDDAVMARLAQLGCRMPSWDYIPWSPALHAAMCSARERQAATMLMFVARCARSDDECSLPFLPKELWFLLFDLLFSYSCPDRPRAAHFLDQSFDGQ